MRELIQAVPDADVLLRLTPEELGGKIVFLLRKRWNPPAVFRFSPYNLSLELWHTSNLPGVQTSYPPHLRDQINLAIAEAWGWLVAQGLLVSSMEQGVHGFYELSRRALAFENPTDFARFAVARTLSKEALHARIADAVWLAFMRGEFDIAVFQAMKAVEVSVREASGLADDLTGVKLMRKAFDPANGPLTDQSAETGEREACSALFAGAIGMYKNPQSHRDVNLDNPAEAAEIIMMANNLLRVVDARQSAYPSNHTDKS